MRLFSLPRITRVKGGAESALESFEELQKEFKWSLFVGSALFSLVVWILSDLNSETCLEIAKVIFRRKSVVSVLIWAREELRFQIQVFSPARALLHVLYFPTHVCLPPISTIPPRSLSSFFSLLLSPSIVSLARLHSFLPRSMVTPQLCSCCWERGLTRRPRIRWERKKERE